MSIWNDGRENNTTISSMICTSRFHKIASFALICGYSDRVERGGSDGGTGLISFIVLPKERAEEVHLFTRKHDL
jgi:hypothetical protein